MVSSGGLSAIEIRTMTKANIPFFLSYNCGLSVGFGDTFQFVLLLDGVAVGRSLGGVDQLIGQALGDGLDVTEGGLTSSGAAQPDSLQ